MANSAEVKLFGYAMKQIDEAGIGAEKWTIGGGTVLKHVLRHRESRDIDIFLEDPQLLGSLSPRMNEANELDLLDYRENANGMQLTFPEGKVDFVVAGRVTSFPPKKAAFHGREVFLDDPVEIVAKKIYHRADYFHPRDCFDLAALYLSDRKDDLTAAAAVMPDKIGVLKRRIEKISEDKEFLKPVVPAEEGKHIRGREFSLVKDFIRDVEAYIRTS